MERRSAGDHEVNPTKAQLDEADEFLRPLQLAEGSDEAGYGALVRDTATMIAVSDERLANAALGQRHAAEFRLGDELIAVLSERTEKAVSRRILFGNARKTSVLIKRFMHHADEE